MSDRKLVSKHWSWMVSCFNFSSTNHKQLEMTFDEVERLLVKNQQPQLLDKFKYDFLKNLREQKNRINKIEKKLYRDSNFADEIEDIFKN